MNEGKSQELGIFGTLPYLLYPESSALAFKVLLD